MRKNKISKIFIAILLLVSLEASVIAASIGVVNKDTVRVRSKAKTDSAIVALVSIGDKVTITGEEGDWYKVKAKDEDGNMKTGYIRKDLLTVDGKTSTVIPDEPDKKEEQAEPEKPVVTEKPVEGEQSEENNNTGSEDKTPEDTTDDNGETPAENSEGETTNKNTETVVERNDISIDTIKKSVNLSEGKKLQLTKNTKIKILPLANSRNIIELQANTEVTVLEVINSWCRIESAEGACGWVRIDQ